MEKSKYVLSAFPYPSGHGLHVGHAYSYGLMDSYCNYLRYKGVEVFQPFGSDTFGLPTELFAKKMGRDPFEVANENIKMFSSQMSKLNTKYEYLLSTADKSYVKWTQWIFLKLLEKGLAYKKLGNVNWCPSCETALSNEQVKDNCCERCSSKIEDKQIDQWYLRITSYTDRLSKNLDTLDYPEYTKKLQRQRLETMSDWSVGRQRKFGCPIPIDGEVDTLDTFLDSSFYHIRYCDPTNEKELCSLEKYKPVDLYCVGSELSTNHLIYVRFIHMFLYDIGVVPTEEPFKKVIHNGFILGSDNQKMSKSKGNVINPDDYDPDELRLYLSFIAHFFDGGVWSDKNINGIRRFISRFKEWMSREGEDVIDIEPFKTKIFDHTDKFKFNKVVSEFMILVNSHRDKNLTSKCKEELLKLIHIYSPGI